MSFISKQPDVQPQNLKANKDFNRQMKTYLVQLNLSWGKCSRARSGLSGRDSRQQGEST